MVTFNLLLNAVVTGILLGGFYAAVTVGIAISFGMLDIGNLAHPACYVADHYRSRVTRKYLQRQFEVVLLCRDWLAERNNKSLREHMKAEGLI